MFAAITRRYALCARICYLSLNILCVYRYTVCAHCHVLYMCACLGSVYVYPGLIGSLSLSWLSHSFSPSLDMLRNKTTIPRAATYCFRSETLPSTNAEQCPKRLIDDRLELTVLSVTKIDYALNPATRTLFSNLSVTLEILTFTSFHSFTVVIVVFQSTRSDFK